MSETRDTVFSRIARSIGPGLVTACVVIGPGSILTSSKVGATEGYSRIWVVILSVFFMMVFTTLAARLGAVSGRSTGDLVRERAGRPLAALIGICIFFICSAFQFGNNLGVYSALDAYFPFKGWIVVLNAAAIAFIFALGNLYRSVERLMTVFVGVMLIAFAVNLGFARPDVGEMASGLLPWRGEATLGLPILGLIGTTFIVTAAYYQSYLVRFKGWTAADLRAGLIDARVSATIMLLITLMIMSTAAAVLRGKELGSVGEVAEQLRPLFGETGRAIFCIGLFSAGFSSFLVNSMIGGFILADSLKLGDQPDQWWPRVLTVVVLLIGMIMALLVVMAGFSPVGAIVAAQAVTVIASPLLGAVLLWLTNLKGVMGEHRNGPWLNASAGVGLVLLTAMAWYTATAKVYPKVRDAISPPAVTAPAEATSDAK